MFSFFCRTKISKHFLKPDGIRSRYPETSISSVENIKTFVFFKQARIGGNSVHNIGPQIKDVAVGGTIGVVSGGLGAGGSLLTKGASTVAQVAVQIGAGT
jgi:hypothetical protein